MGGANKMAETRTAAQRRWHCPNCDQLVSPRPANDPYCPYCRENLYKCRHCRFGDTHTWECTNEGMLQRHGDELGRWPIPEPEYSWRCPFYTTGLTSLPYTRLLRTSTIAGSFLIAILLIIFLLTRSTEQPNTIAAHLDWPNEIRIGTEGIIHLLARNEGDDESNKLRLHLEGTLINNVDIDEAHDISPKPDAYERSSTTHIAWFKKMKPREEREIRVALKPRTPGSYNLKVTVYHGDKIIKGTRRRSEISDIDAARNAPPRVDHVEAVPISIH